LDATIDGDEPKIVGGEVLLSERNNQQKYWWERVTQADVNCSYIAENGGMRSISD